LVALRAARRSGAPVLLTSHTRYDLYLDAYLPWLPRPPAQAALRALLRRITDGCAAVIAPSPGAAAALATWGVRAPVTVIPNGVEVGPFSAAAEDGALRAQTRAALGLPPGQPLAIYVGRLGAEKRVRALLATFALALEAGATGRLLLVGEGAQAAELRADAARLPAGRVLLVGARPYAEIPALLAAADFFVTASLSENHPLTLLEAAAAGLPVLGHAAPGVADVVNNGVTGLLAPPPVAPDAPAPPDAGLLLRWLALDGNAALRARLAAGAADASRSFGAKATAAQVLALYRRLLGAGSPSRAHPFGT
jgi:glycosyltransferase involved in cell wall biosynthesis